MFTRIVTALFILLVIASSVAAQSSRRTAAQKRADGYERRLGTADRCAAAARIDTRTPIGEFDAYVLAWAYFLSRVNGCGFPELPEDAGDRWIARTRHGFAGQPGPPIIIQKSGGATYSPGKPKVSRPKDFARFAKNI